MQIKAIPTQFDGYQFRSRTEARWAVFLWLIVARYVYEPEGYILPSGVCYLPDFFLPEMDLYIEVKGVEPTNDELDKAKGLAVGLKKDVLIVQGPPEDDRKGSDFFTWKDDGLLWYTDGGSVEHWIQGHSSVKICNAVFAAKSWKFGRVA